MPVTTIGHYINGQVALPKAGRSQDVFNPATGAVTGKVLLASSADVDAAVASAQAAFPAWADLPPLRRARANIVGVERQHGREHRFVTHNVPEIPDKPPAVLTR